MTWPRQGRAIFGACLILRHHSPSGLIFRNAVYGLIKKIREAVFAESVAMLYDFQNGP
jgi:hypothetical protein